MENAESIVWELISVGEVEQPGPMGIIAIVNGFNHIITGGQPKFNGELWLQYLLRMRKSSRDFGLEAGSSGLSQQWYVYTTTLMTRWKTKLFWKRESLMPEWKSTLPIYIYTCHSGISYIYDIYYHICHIYVHTSNIFQLISDETWI